MGAHQQQCQGFARYNLEFNARLYDTVARLDEADYRRDLGAFFGSIHATLNHILLADRIWLGRFATVFPQLASLRDAEVLHQVTSLGQELYADFETLRAARERTDRVILAWADELDDALLAQPMRYANTRGEWREHPAWLAVAHLFNHQTHHRGQVTTLLHQLGHDPGVTDYFAYVLGHHPAPGGAEPTPAGPVAFHLSLPVRDLDETRAFYCGLLGATPGRATAGWIDLVLFGHQLTFHAQPDQVRPPEAQGVQHFGAILPWPAWEALCRDVAAAGYPGADPPRIHAPGTPQEHGKLLLRDPSGHLLELKAYREPGRVLEPT